MDSREGRSGWSGATSRRPTVGEQAGVAWRAVERSLHAGTSRAREALQRHFDGGYAPLAPDAGADRAAPGMALSEVTVAYQGRPAIEDVAVDFPPGSMTAIVGPNGAGKSTLLKALAGILVPRAGRIASSAAGAGDVAYLPQSDEVDRSFPISVGEFVALGRWRQFGAFRPVAPAIADALGAALEAVGLAAAQDRPIAALSVGQFRRALFARLMLQDAGALLLDEPFAAIDATTMADLLRLVERWHEEGRTIVAVLHDLGQVSAHFPRTVLLARRCIAAGDTAEVLMPENLALAGFGSRDVAAP
ncbi:MAG TPA: metal ABC transporter ATP-binding protein [Stellaceae bacterium]